MAQKVTQEKEGNMKHSAEIKADGMNGTKLQAESLTYLGRVP